MSADEFDRASERETTERELAILAHVNRPVAAPPVCPECEEHPCHVASNGVVFRFCSECCEEHQRSRH